jgi:hypothetical protein
LGAWKKGTGTAFGFSFVLVLNDRMFKRI